MASLSVQYSRSEISGVPVFGYGLSVRVTNAVDMPKKILVIYRTVPSVTDTDAQTPDVLDEFNHVAVPADLSNIPEDAPMPDTFGNHAYRTDQWTFSFRTPEELEDSWNLLRQDIKALVFSLNAEKKMEFSLEETYE